MARFPDGQEIRSRTVWSWGIKKRLVRMRRYVLGKEGEAQRYETVVYFDAKDKRLEYRVFTAAGAAGTGTVFTDRGEIVLQQKALETFPAMRSGFRVSAKKKECATRLWFKGKEGWKLRGESKSVHEELTPAKILPIGGKANPLAALEPLARLPGWSWSLHKRLLHGPTLGGGEVFVSFQPKEGVLLFLLVHAGGAIYEGTMKADGKDRFIWQIAANHRRVLRIRSPKEFEVWDEKKSDGDWKRVGKGKSK